MIALIAIVFLYSFLLIFQCFYTFLLDLEFINNTTLKFSISHSYSCSFFLTRVEVCILRTLHVVCREKFAKYLRKICEKFAKYLRNICKKFAKILQNIRKKYAKNLRKICEKFAKKLQKIKIR